MHIFTPGISIFLVLCFQLNYTLVGLANKGLHNKTPFEESHANSLHVYQTVLHYCLGFSTFGWVTSRFCHKGCRFISYVCLRFSNYFFNSNFSLSDNVITDVDQLILFITETIVFVYKQGFDYVFLFYTSFSIQIC